jgi:hypothetical protein
MEQMTPDEIQQTAVALRQAFETGAISAKEFDAGMTDVTKGIKNYTAELNASLNQLGTASKKLGQDLLAGGTGMSQYNDVVASGGDAVGKFASQFGPMGMAVGVLIKVITFGIAEISKMGDALYKANQDLSKSGAAGAEGMSGVFDNMQKFGYGIKDLGDMSAVIAENSNSLSLFGGTVEQGVAQFANMAKGIKNSDLQREFMNMGMSVNDITKGIAGYIAVQAQLGIQSQETEEEKTRNAAAYIQQQDRLTKITGQSAEQLKTNQAKAQQVEAFNAKLASMAPAEAAKMQAGFDMLAKTSETAAMGFAASVTGMVGLTKESSQTFQATGGASVALTKQFEENIKAGMDSTQAAAIMTQGYADATAKNKGLANSMAMIGGDSGMGKIGEINRMSALAGGKALDAVEAARVAQEKQKAGADKNTNEYTKMVQEQMATRDTMQGVLEKGIGPATSAFATLAEVINKVLYPFGGKQVAPPTGEKGAAVPAAAPAPGGPGQKMSVEDLKAMGLEVKKGDVQKEGAEISPNLIALAKKIQGGVPGFRNFTGFNDTFHNEKSPKSLHTKGLALDFALTKKPSVEEGKQIVAGLRNMGATTVIDEYNSPSAKATAGHIHAAVSARDGAVLSGPESGYKPNLTMHGTEAIVPVNQLRDMQTGRSGYESTQLSSAQDTVPTVNPDMFGEAAVDMAEAGPSLYDQLNMQLDNRILAAVEAKTRTYKRKLNAVS